MKRFLLSPGLILIILLMFFSGCGKTGLDCLTSTGEIILQEREITPFDSVEIYDNVSLFITEDTLYKLEVECGENIIGGIETVVENGNLVIHNTNTCNWVRSFDHPINVYISTPHLWKLYYNASGDVSSLTSLSGDSLKLEVWGGCGRIDLSLDIRTGFCYLQLGTADIHLKGSCGVVSIYSGDFGLIDARDLTSGFAFVSNKSSNDCYIRVHQKLTASIQSIGNIYYTGNPAEIETTINGAGSVIPF